MFHKNYIFALLLLIPLLVGGYFVFESGNSAAQIVPSLAPTTQPKQIVLPKDWVLYKDAYITFGHPKSWEVRPVPNQDPLVDEVMSVEQSENEKDIVSAPDTAYKIFVHKNSIGADAMTVAKNDIAQNWHPSGEPQYNKYAGSDYDAVSVENIVARKTQWGQSVYMVSKDKALQIISEVQVQNPNTYFYPLVNTITFVQ